MRAMLNMNLMRIQAIGGYEVLLLQHKESNREYYSIRSIDISKKIYSRDSGIVLYGSYNRGCICRFIGYQSSFMLETKFHYYDLYDPLFYNTESILAQAYKTPNVTSKTTAPAEMIVSTVVIKSSNKVKLIDNMTS